jgi:DNA invertase Pin-like site-specific DNA recombinase
MKIIGYVRVSTVRQGESGLGLEAQLSAIHKYAADNNGQVLHVYREVESGRKDDRPEFQRAQVHAQRVRGRLVIGKLDRLSRDVHFVSGLIKSGVEFICCDNPHATKLTIHILAAVAEDEADRISQRTKAALTAAKARGVLLGSSRPGHWRGREVARQAGAAKGSQVAKAKREVLAGPLYAEVLPVIRGWREAGGSLQEIADDLNGRGFCTMRGQPWNRVQVRRLLKADDHRVA